MTKNGQATMEIAIMFPLFILLAGGALSVGYMCYQGIKAQQAANLAARIQGQERVMGAANPQFIMNDNGVGLGTGDQVSMGADGSLDGVGGTQGSAPPLKSVYGRFYKAAKDFFGANDRVLVPPPTHQGVNTDQVAVIRVMVPPKIWTLQLKPVTVEATAYGGEDPRMYGLPRWGNAGNGASFYQSQIKDK